MEHEENEVSVPEYIGSATYSPEDNKLRLYADARLDAATYARVKAAGFAWAPKQQLFVAPMWTPQRWDLLVELCGGVDDEGTSLEERAAVRAERFAGYKANRTRDAHAGAARVEQLTDGVPLGQPILIGHHSQHKAEKHAQKIKNAMGYAVEMWSRAEYWTGRIPAVLRHAEWKNDEGLRHRRIKGLEADERKHAKSLSEAEYWLNKWNDEELPTALAWKMADYDRSGAYNVLREGGKYEHGGPVPAEVMAAARVKGCAQHEINAAWHQRWLDHIRLRLAYERELMEQAGGTMDTRFDVQVGGRVMMPRESKVEWLTVLRVNKASGKVNSLTVSTPANQRSWRGSQMVRPIEEVTAYEPPVEGEPVTKAARVKVLPLCNYPSPDAVNMTAAEYKAIPERHRENARYYPDGKARWEARATHRRTQAWIEGSDAWGGTHKWVYLTDKKTTHPPSEDKPEPKPAEPVAEPLPFTPSEVDMHDVAPPVVAPAPAQQAEVEEDSNAGTLFAGFKETLKNGGVQVAVAHQLYPTPPEVAEQMVEYAEIKRGMVILEPSAGTGNILQAIMNEDRGIPVAVEINQKLADHLGREYPLTTVHCMDFLEYDRSQWPVDRVIMNPPFEKGADIKHIQHALKFLKPGGKLVAICANGPRQQAQLKPLSSHWEELPAGTFKNTGTMVNTALLVIDKA